MNGGFFVGQGVFCLDVKFFTPRIFFRSRIRNFRSRIFRHFFFLPQGTPRIFFSLDAYPKEPQGFRVKMFLRQGFFENWWKWLSNSKKAPCINETNYITMYIKFLALKFKWKSCKGAKITPFHHKFLLLMI